MNETSEPIIVEQTFSTSIQNVWNAITQIDQMQQWYFENIGSFQPEVGFETEFNVESQGRNFLHQWKVTEVVPPKKITYDWRYGNYPGDSFVTFEIFEEENHARLRLTCVGIENFPGDVPEFTRESCTEGWNYFLKKRLVEYLGNKG